MDGASRPPPSGNQEGASDEAQRLAEEARLPGKKEAGLNAYVLACALLASLSSTLLGYDIGVMSGAVLFVEEDMQIQTFQKELLVGSLNLVSLLGGAFAGRLSDQIGRRGGMMTAAGLFLVGALGMSVAPSYGILLVGRLVTGLGVGAALLIAPLYTAELAPAGLRGALVSLTEVFINVGILLGYIASYALSGLAAHLAWRWMVGLGAVPAFFLGFGALFMPESPRWLVMHGKVEQALSVLLLTSSGDREDAQERLTEIVESIQGKDEGRLKRERSLLPESEANETHRLHERHQNTEHKGSITVEVRKEADGRSIHERRKSEEIARLQRVGVQFGNGGIELTDVSGTSPSIVKHSPTAALYQSHEGTDAFARGELDAAGGLEELVNEGGGSGSGVWRDLILHPTPVVKRMLLIGLGSNFFQQATGVDAIVYYAPAVFSLAGITSRSAVLASTIVVGAAKAGFVLVAVFLLDRGWGRRPLLLMSAIGCTASLLTLAFGFLLLGGGIDQKPSGQTTPPNSGLVRRLAPILAVTATCAYMAFFSAGLGPVNWVLVSEIFPSRLRAQAMGLATVVNRTISGTVSLTFLSIAETITAAGTFLLFAIIGLISIAFFHYLVPETKGKSLEDIEKMLTQTGGVEVTLAAKGQEAKSVFAHIFDSVRKLLRKGYTELHPTGTDEAPAEDQEDRPPRKVDGDTHRIDRLTAASEQLDVRLSLRDKVKAIALRESGKAPTERSRMLED